MSSPIRRKHQTKEGDEMSESQGEKSNAGREVDIVRERLALLIDGLPMMARQIAGESIRGLADEITRAVGAIEQRIEDLENAKTSK